jgi:tRNA(Ile)-lysidine synthase
MDLLQSFKDFIAAEDLFSPGEMLLLAVSGGLDSVVLCELCDLAGFPFAIAHAHFGLRGEESDRDERFVCDLSAKYQVPLATRRFDTRGHAEEHKVSVQVAARELRYGWFNELIGSGAPHPDLSAGMTPSRILTAHHLDDNIETLLMNFFKGTGMAGLHGILPRQGALVRPLLFARKADLLRFAADRRLDWVEDSSNSSDTYTRNYLRHQIIPALEQAWPGSMNNLAANIGRFREAESLYRQSLDLHKSKLLEAHGDETRIPVLKLKVAVPLRTICYEIIHGFGFSPGQVDDVLRLLDSGSGKQVLSPTHRILRDRNWLIISPHQDTAGDHILIEAPSGVVHTATMELRLSLQSLPQASEPSQPSQPSDSPATHFPTPPMSTAPSTAQLDASLIHFPLLLRKWRKGDYFYPLGMRKKKKLGRFFIDNKFSLNEKEKAWVLEMDRKVIWVVGHRIDDRFKVTPATRQILKIESGMG